MYVVIVPDNVIGPIFQYFDSFYEAVLHADPLEHIGAKIYELVR